MELFGFTVRRAHRAKSEEEGSPAEVRLTRLEAEVRLAREEAQRLAIVARQLEAGELAREAAFSKGIESLRSVLGRIDVGRRHARPAHRGRGDNGDAEHDGFQSYLALRGHAPGAAAARLIEADDVTEEGE